MKLNGLALLAALLPLSQLSCSSPVPAEVQSELDPAFQALPGGFSPEAAWRNLRDLADMGPRVSGSLGAAQARGYIERQLVAAGARLIPLPGASAPAAPAPEGAPTAASTPSSSPPAAPPPQVPEPVDVLAEIPGASSDVILLMAPYDTRQIEGIRFLGVNDGGSGAALLLELARVIAAKPLPYTTWFLFLDGEAAGPDGRPALRGSTAFAQAAKASGTLSRIRLAVFANCVCDADLRIARDLPSHRMYRNAFWDAAARLGYSDHFDQRSFQSLRAGHLPLRAVGMMSVVALEDESFGGGDPPGAYANTENDDLAHCAPESLEVVGRVVLEGLDDISARLLKIDRFASSPLSGIRDESLGAPEPREPVLPASTQPPAEPPAPASE